TGLVLPRLCALVFAGLLILTGVVGFDVAPATAQDKKASTDAWGVVIQPRDPQKIIEMFDRNKDGKIDQTEYTLGIVAFFIRLDKNDDGFLTRDEVPGMKDEAFDMVDADKDGKISDYEFVTSDALKFDRVDTNSDGYITADEIAAYQKSRK
ncbi:MAG: hypothetical protein AAF942_12430, partial [Pseudomonadota bacterium]